MPRLTNSVPKSRMHRASKQAVVTIAGRDHYLGPHGTKASKLEYDRVITEWLAAGRPSLPGASESDLTITELCARYWGFAKQHYQKRDKGTSERDVCDGCRQDGRRPEGENNGAEARRQHLRCGRPEESRSHEPRRHRTLQAISRRQGTGRHEHRRVTRHASIPEADAGDRQRDGGWQELTHFATDPALSP